MHKNAFNVYVTTICSTHMLHDMLRCVLHRMLSILRNKGLPRKANIYYESVETRAEILSLQISPILQRLPCPRPFGIEGLVSLLLVPPEKLRKLVQNQKQLLFHIGSWAGNAQAKQLCGKFKLTYIKKAAQAIHSNLFQQDLNFNKALLRAECSGKVSHTLCRFISDQCILQKPHHQEVLFGDCRGLSTIPTDPESTDFIVVQNFAQS